MYTGIFYFRQTSRYCNEMNAKTSDFYSYSILFLFSKWQIQHALYVLTAVLTSCVTACSSPL